MGVQQTLPELNQSPEPKEANLIDWKDIQPTFVDLLNRSLESAIDLERWIKDKSKLDARLSEEFAWRYIRVTCNSDDREAAQAFSHFVQQISPKVAELENQLNIRLVNCPFFELLDDKTYGTYRRKVKNAVSLFSAKNVNLQKEVQLQSKEFGRILSQMTIGFDGQQLTLQKASTLLEERDRNIRRQVYHKINQRIVQDTEELEDLFDSLLAKRHQIALNAGFENYRDYAFHALERFDYTPEDCFNFHESISTEILPILNTIYQTRKESLHLDSLRPYDLNIDTKGREVLRPFQNTSELVEQSIACLNQVHPKFGSVIEKMKDLGHLDLDSRPGKRPGGYNMPLYQTGVPFIFMNGTNSINDLRTLMHESGHAVHAYLTRNLEIAATRQFPSEISELAAMTMELFTMEHWDTIFTHNEDLQRAKLFQMELVIKVLPWIATIDKFQHWLYTNPGHSRQERREKWLAILQEFTPEVLENAGLEKYLSNLWVKQLHIFEVPFYYIEYGFAQLGAIALWKKYNQGAQSATEAYINALKLGYTRSVSDIYEAAGIRFDFSKGYVSKLGNFMKEHIEKLVH